MIVDNGFARKVSRFEVYSVHTIPLPHYTRLLGTCLLIPNFHPLAPEEVIQEIIRHLGGPGDNPGRRAWLAEHHEQFDRRSMPWRWPGAGRCLKRSMANLARRSYALARPAAECMAATERRCRKLPMTH